MCDQSHDSRIALDYGLRLLPESVCRHLLYACADICVYGVRLTHWQNCMSVVADSLATSFGQRDLRRNLNLRASQKKDSYEKIRGSNKHSLDKLPAGKQVL